MGRMKTEDLTLYPAVLLEAEIRKFLMTFCLKRGNPLLMTSLLCHNILLHKRGEKYGFYYRNRSLNDVALNLISETHCYRLYMHVY